MAVLESVKLQEFMDRKGLTQQQLAEKIGVNRGAIGKWNTHVTDVTRENCAKLLLAGMTLEEMFGKEVADCVKKAVLEEANNAQAKIQPNPDNSPIDYNDPKFQEGFEKTLAGMKARGMIKDEVAKTIAEMKANGEL